MSPNDGAHKNPTETGTTINPTPLTDKVTDVVIATKMTTLLTENEIEVEFL